MKSLIALIAISLLIAFSACESKQNSGETYLQKGINNSPKVKEVEQQVNDAMQQANNRANEAMKQANEFE